MNKVLKFSKKVRHDIMPNGGSCSLTTSKDCNGVLIYAVYKTPNTVTKKVTEIKQDEFLCH